MTVTNANHFTLQILALPAFSYLLFAIRLAMCGGLIVNGFYYASTGARPLTRCLGYILTLYSVVALIGVITNGRP